MTSLAMPAGEHLTDIEMSAQFERIIRRVKFSMNYHGSYSTRDILGSLVARWVQSGEWQRLRGQPPDQRQIGASVRHFILDRFEQLRTRGEHVEVAEDLAIPDDSTLLEMVELADLQQWLDARVSELERGVCDPRTKINPRHPTELGRILRLVLAGSSQRRIATALGVSLGLVNKRIAEGINYLSVLQGIEHGIELSE